MWVIWFFFFFKCQSNKKSEAKGGLCTPQEETGEYYLTAVMFTGWLPPPSSPLLPLEHPSTSDQSPSPHIIITQTPRLLPKCHWLARLSQQETTLQTSPKNGFRHHHIYPWKESLPYVPKILFCQAQIFKSLWKVLLDYVVHAGVNDEALAQPSNKIALTRPLFDVVDNDVLTTADVDVDVVAGGQRLVVGLDWGRLCVTWWQQAAAAELWRRTFAGFAPLTRPPYTHSRPIMPPYRTIP